jgi:glycogenin
MKAFVTYLSSDDYFIGVLALHKSWKEVQSKHPLYCMVTPDISNHVLEELSKRKIYLIKTQKLKLPQNLIRYNRENCPRGQDLLENYFNKLVIFGLDQFEKIIYMDADMIMIKNIDHLFDEPHMSAIPDNYNNGVASLNSALMVIEPRADLLKDMYKKLSETSQQDFYNGANQNHHCLWDQDYINLYFSNWSNDPATKIPVNYNSFTSAFYCYGIEQKDVMVAHLVRTKPWFMGMDEMYNILRNDTDKSGFMYKKFLHYLIEIIKELML